MMRFPKDVLRRRKDKFQGFFREKGIDAVMLRTLSSFKYITGIKWIRPALLIPAEGEPKAFVARGEEEGFLSRTWIEDVETYTDGGDLMAKISGIIRREGYKVVGMEYGIERDAYILFYEVFKRLNSRVKIVDVGPILSKMRMIKDEWELDAIRKAGEIASKSLERSLSVVEEGVTETDIASEAYATLYKLGSEEPHVYVNSGPNPRIHAEPLRDEIVRKNSFVTIVIGADYNGYYANASNSIFIGEPKGVAEKAVKCTDEVYKAAVDSTRLGVRFTEVMRILDKIYTSYGMLDYRVMGYTHAVGLQIEESPITTILPGDRSLKVEPGMVLAMVHAPILLGGYGQIKQEDTFIVKESGELEKVT